MSHHGLHFCVLASLAASCALARADGDRAFHESVQPILKEHCHTCHSTEKQKGDLDLEQFTSIAAIRKQPAIWERVLEQLANNEMPPRKERQLSAEQKVQLTAWVQAMLDEVALANAGDPGPVVLRRLSNVEYTYTVRDLTGVESLDPAREFPADGAAGEGFTNAGAALVMSPALLAKYLEAAKEIASHAVLLPDGIRFSAHTSQRDWTDEILAKIRAFYAEFSASGGGTSVDLQGIKFDTNGGGVLPLEKYLAATLENREALAGGAKTIPQTAMERGLNAKYLGALWKTLNDSTPSLVLDIVRQQWRAAKPTEAAAIAATVAQWQRSLWRFTSVGHIGKLNGPQSWLVPVLPVTSSEELRVKLPAVPADREVILYLAAHEMGDASGHDFAAFENARLVTPGRPDVPVTTLPDKVRASSVTELHLPANAPNDTEFVVNCRLHPDSDPDGSVQIRFLTAKPAKPLTLTASGVTINKPKKKGTWSDGEKPLSFDAPILVRDDSDARRRITAAMAEFRDLFPAALCYAKIVPVDEVVTLTLLHREDGHLKRLMLDDAQAAALDRMWDELRFVSEAPLKQVDVFEQLWQFATQDADPSAFEPMREPILQAAAAFRKLRVEVEPKHMLAVLDFAARAWRRALTDAEQSELHTLYQKLRMQDLPHESAVRMMIARVLVAPAFLYRGENAAPGVKAAPVNDSELATRLSYFLWSSSPDDELRALSASGKLHDPEVLIAQTRRMMSDAKIRRLATEFGCQWLHVRDLETLDEKSKRHFPTFVSLRGAMQEEAVRFFTDLFQEDRSVLSLLNADHTFVNDALAKHYGLTSNPKSEPSAARQPRAEAGQIGNQKSDGWQRVDGLRARGRGGILGFASTLAKQSGASRTSPILRGNWLTEVLLGEKLPRPPKDVPVLPEETPQGLTERQLIERHSSEAKCAVCHERMDPFGFALEGFDAIGRARSSDAAGLSINTRVKLRDGTRFDGLDGLRSYLLDTRRDDFLRQFCRKLLGYALGRSVQLSDKPLLETMLARLKASDYRVGTMIELIVRSPQFREVRGRDYISSN